MDLKFCKILEDNKEKFELFYKILLEYNEKFNLTSLTDEKSVSVKHFYDSVYGQNLFEKGAKVIEIGSGGGFPSVPLKIVRDDLKFTLVESTAKKCEYLSYATKSLGFADVKVLNIRAEDGGRNGNLREKFDFCIARAVARLNTLCEYCLPFVKVGGKFLAYKGADESELPEARKAIEILGGKIKDVVDYDLPEDFGKRKIIVIEKVKPTPLKYPRGRGLERKKPL